MNLVASHVFFAGRYAAHMSFIEAIGATAEFAETGGREAAKDFTLLVVRILLRRAHGEDEDGALMPVQTWERVGRDS
jgi:hypothetical protein